jgi:hypothetical protein
MWNRLKVLWRRITGYKETVPYVSPGAYISNQRTFCRDWGTDLFGHGTVTIQKRDGTTVSFKI